MTESKSRSQETFSQVSVYLYGNRLDPEQITELLGIPATTARRRGDARTGSTGQVYVQKIGVWGVKIGEVAAKVPELVDRVIDLLGPQEPSLADLPNVDEGKIEIFVSLLSDSGSFTWEEQLSPEQLMALGAYGLPLRFTVYGTPPG